MESISRDLRSRRFWTLLATQAFAFVGAVAVVGGIIVLFDQAFFQDKQCLGWLTVLGALAYGALRAWPRPVATRYTAPETTIRLVRGSLFDQRDAHLIVGASDTFDTAPPHIAPNSVQGQFLQRVYGGDAAKLDADLAPLLHGLKPEETISGKPGKQLRYPLGTTLAIRSNARRYFLVAYSRMDEKSSASSTTDGFWNSLSELWRVVRAESNGEPVCIPLIGGGQSKLSPMLPAGDSARFIALSFMLASRTRKVCDELIIVAQPEQYDKLDHLELQAFLKSLRPS